MGEQLFDEVPEFAAMEKDVDRLLGYSVRRLCLDDRNSQLNDTFYTQPCLYVVNALHYYKAMSERDRPSFVAGHSLGEYNALLAAGVFDFLTGLRLVQKRGELMSRTKSGGMAAVIGLPEHKVSDLIARNFSALDVANFNSPLQIVLSGPLEVINRAGPVFEREGASMFIPLPVSSAFHSRYMQDASNAFGGFLNTVTFHPPKLPVISNVTGMLYPVEPGEIKALLARQITHPVKWTHTIQYLMRRGVSSFKELGPGNVLTRLLQQMRPQHA